MNNKNNISVKKRKLATKNCGKKTISQMMHAETTRFIATVLEAARTSEAQASDIAWLRSASGLEVPPPQANALMTRARRRMARAQSERTRQLARGEMQFCRVTLTDARWSCDIGQAHVDIKQMLTDTRTIRRGICPNGIWALRPYIGPAKSDDEVDEKLRFKMCGLIFAPDLHDTIDANAEVHRRSMREVGSIDPISIRRLSGRLMSFNSAARDMWSISVADFCGSDSNEKTAAQILTVAALLSVISFKNLGMGDGAGKEILRGMVKEVCGWVDGNGRNKTTHAHPDRFTRDLAHVMRSTGLRENDLPYVIVR